MNGKRKKDQINIAPVLILSWCLFFSSCVPAGSSSQKRSSGEMTTSGGTLGDDSGGNSDGSGNNATGADSSIISTLTTGGKQDLRHIIDPYDGKFKTKVTIPKNYSGFLHLSGLNFSSLTDRLVSARFSFGREKFAVVIPGVISRVEGLGITPQTDIQVLTLDLSGRPFNDINLLYNLYDYNDYDSNEDRTEFGTGDSLTEPVSDYRDTKLYCRGLNLEDDTTFSITSTNDQCDAAGERCLYSYVKILDSAMYTLDSNSLLRSVVLSNPAIELGSSGYTGDTEAQQQSKCLPDTSHRGSLETTLQTTMSSSNATTLAYEDTGFSTTYTYKGPFRTANRTNWEMSGDALFSNVASGDDATGIFQYTLSDAPAATATDPNLPAQAGIKSFLFPRAGKMDLKSGVQYMGFTDLTDPLGLVNASATRTVQTMVSSGESEYVDGCNIRQSTTVIEGSGSVSNENISSCNVTATIDLIYTDDDGNIITLATSKEIKLQIARTSTQDDQGNELLYTALKSCNSANACGSNECCFNQRCWSDELVAQCPVEGSDLGNLTVGTSCSSDLECASLCCSSNGYCAPHNTNDPDNQNLCNKAPQEFCVSKEFCRMEAVNTCFLVKTNNGASCEKRCYDVPTFGDCINGLCQQPQAVSNPALDVDSNSLDCSTAIDPPTEFEAN